MSYSMQARPVNPVDPEIILDQNFADNSTEALRSLGARNVDPLAPSTHLKNIHTGVIFPWSPALAEHRDILVNCDASGNTDPAVWKRTAPKDGEFPDAHELIAEAYARITAPRGFMQSASPRLNEQQGAMPYGAQTYEKFTSDEVSGEGEESLEQLARMIE